MNVINHDEHGKVVADDDSEEGEPGRWWTGIVECGICGYRWVAVIQIEEDQNEPVVMLECPQCNNAAGQPIMDEE